MKYGRKLKEYCDLLGLKYFLYKIRCSVFPILGIKNTRYRTLYWQRRCADRLKKYAAGRRSYMVNRERVDIFAEKIWILWLQGEQAMPDIVKKCYASVKQYLQDYEIILLDADTLDKYICLPEFVTAAYRQGRMSTAMYSDLVRLELLTVYGGIWMDATVLLTSAIPAVIRDSDVFMYQTAQNDYTVAKMSNWFIAVQKPDHYIIRAVRDAMYTYWEKEKYPVNPFLFHLMVTALYETDAEFRKEWDEMPYICNMNPHVMWFSFGKIYTEQLWESICHTSAVHKLSWKLNMEAYEENSLCRYLLQ